MVWVPKLIWRVLRRIGPSQMGLLAAGVAYYALLAVFPAIAALFAVAGLFTDPDAVVDQFETLLVVLPPDAATLLLDQAVKIASVGSQGLSLAAVIGFSFALYLSVIAVTALVHGLNVAHGVDDQRGSFRYWGTVIALTIALAFGTIVMFALLVVLPAALALLPTEYLSISTADALRFGRWIIVALIVLLGIGLIYRVGPDKRASGFGITLGAALAAALWFVGSLGFSIYVSNFANYNASFGSLGGVVVLLTWLWLSAYIVFLGAMIDAEIGRLPSSESHD